MTPDLKSMFSQAQAVTVSAAGAYILDLKDHGDDINRILTLLIQVRGAVTATDAATVTFSLNTAAALNAGGTDLSADTLVWTSPTYGKAVLTAGAIPVKIPLPTGTKRYVRLNYTVASGPLDATSTFDAGLFWGVDQP